MLSGLERTLVAEEWGRPPSSMNVFNNFRKILDHELSRFESLPSHRVIDMCQLVYSFPATEAVFHWKNMSEPFIVYGKEGRVRFPYKYPQNCCFKFRCNVS